MSDGQGPLVKVYPCFVTGTTDDCPITDKKPLPLKTSREFAAHESTGCPRKPDKYTMVIV